MTNNSFTTPTARLLFGDPYTAQPIKDDVTKQPKIGKDGQPMFEYVVGVGIAKTDPLWPQFYAELVANDRAAWPQFFDAAGNLLPGVNFASKIYDGDGFDRKGQPHARKEGWAGHWIVKVASQFPPRVVQHNGRDWVDMPKGTLKRGDYVMVNGTTSSNNSSQTPGMYRNLSMVAYVASGQAIVSGPDAATAFGKAAPEVPPGGSATPIPPPGIPGAPAPALPAPAAPAAPAPAAPAGPVMLPAAGGTTYEAYKAAGWSDEQLVAQGYMAAPVAAYTPPPTAPAPQAPAAPGVPPSPAAASPAPANPPAPPYAGYMAAPPAAPAAPAPAPAGPVMLPAANGVTYDAYKAAGWSDEQLVAQGYMAPQ